MKEGVLNNEILVYAELKTKLNYIHVFLTLLDVCGLRGVELRVRRGSVQVRLGGVHSVLHSVHLPTQCDSLLVPTTCHSLQWVAPNQLHFRIQVVPERPVSSPKCETQCETPCESAPQSDTPPHSEETRAQCEATPPHPHDTTALFKKQPFSFRCRVCACQLFQTQRFARVLALPSDAWYGIADSVFCHRHPPPSSTPAPIPAPTTAPTPAPTTAHAPATESAGQERTLVDSVPKLLYPRPDECFVGETHFLLPAACLSRMHVHDKARESRELRCARCRAAFGQNTQPARNGGNGTAAGALKIFMYSVALDTQQHPRVHMVQGVAQVARLLAEQCSHSLAHRFLVESRTEGAANPYLLDPRASVVQGLVQGVAQVARLLAEQCSHALAHRFLVESRTEGAANHYLLLWVLESDCVQLVADTQGPRVEESEEAGEEGEKAERECSQTLESRPIIKVLYLDCLRPQHHSVLRAWRADLTVQPLELPRMLSLQLVSALAASTARLPPTLQQAAGFYVGYLFKDQS